MNNKGGKREPGLQDNSLSGKISRQCGKVSRQTLYTLACVTGVIVILGVAVWRYDDIAESLQNLTAKKEE